MPTKIAFASINRGFASLSSGGELDLSFFGGEPLLEPNLILDCMAYAREQAQLAGEKVRFNLTTNGTVTSPEAWRVMLTDDLDLAVSFDGTPEVHDRHRRFVGGLGSSSSVEQTLRQLIDNGRKVRVNMVVRPDGLGALADGLIYLHGLGIRQVDLSLDLWTVWTAGDGRRLEEALVEAARLWRAWLPEFSLNLFDAKIGAFAALPAACDDTRCGFGDGEVAVAPSGRLYPCERLIGEDRADHPLRLPGHALVGQDFLRFEVAPIKKNSACSGCMLRSACDTDCRCSNFIRTGNVDRADGLLCIFNKAAARAVSEVFDQEQETGTKVHITQPQACYG
jgi:uncharacterized protein